MKQFFWLTVTSLFFALTMSVFAAAPTLDQVLTNLQKTCRNTNDFTANFTQNFRQTLLKRTDHSTGNVKFKKPGLMRWDYTSPHQKSFIVDGKSLWIVNTADRQAMVDRCFKQDNLTASISFLWGMGNLKRDFIANFLGDSKNQTDNIHLSLVPKQKEAPFKKLVIAVDPKTWRVTESIVVDLQDNTNQFIFSNLRFNQKLSEKVFKFAPDSSYTITEVPTCKITQTKL